LAVPSYPLDDIRARCDIVEVVSPYVALKRSGKSLKGLCPFHAEKTPSFIVNADTQRWMCFGCGEKGDVFSFIMRTEGVTFPEAVEQLAAKAGVDITHASGNTRSAGERDLVLRANNLAAVYFRKMLERSQEAQEYLRRRGVTPEAAEKFKLGYVGSEWSGLATYLRGQKVRPEDAAKAGLLVARDNDNGQWFFDLFRNRLIFPIQDVQGRVVAFGGRALAQGDVKYINSPETKAFVKNKTLYALNLARKSIVEQNSVVLVEGYMDALTAHAAGFTNVVATMGTALTPEHVRLLSRYTRSAVLAFDADSAGMSAAVRGAPMFEEAEFDVKVAPMPPGEDPDSLIRRGDRAVFAELVADALPIPDYRLRIVSGKHDVTTRAGQVALLKESIPVIAEVVSEVERERLIATLAPYHPNFRSGTTPAETHIRREIDAWRSKAAQKHPAAPKTVAANPGRVDLLSEEGKAVRKAERELLGNIICSNTRVVEVFSQIPPDAFVSEDARAVAAAVHEEFADGGTLNIDSLTVRLANTAGEGLLIELLVSVSELSATPIADLIGTIKTYRNKELEKRFRNLAEKIQRGEIKRTDKEFSEYWQLVRDLHT
jgi:DNA primase